MTMEPNESMNQDRFSAILENQRAIMVNQATILHNQNKIMRGMEQLFTFFPALQSSLPIQNTIPGTVTVAPLPAHLGSSENSRVEQPPVSSATQLPSGAPPPSVSPSPRVENTTPINTPTRPQAPLNSSTPSMVANPVKPLPSSGASSPDTDNEQDVAPPVRPSSFPQQYISADELTQIKCKSCSIGNFAVQLLRHIFENNELENRNCTGTRGKEAVDPERLRFVKETVFDVYAIASDDKVNTWKHCVRAIDEFLRRPKRMAKGALNKSALF